MAIVALLTGIHIGRSSKRVMKNQLSDQQITSYRDGGFLVIPDFLGLAELDEWRRCTGEAVAVQLGHSIDFLTKSDEP